MTIKFPPPPTMTGELQQLNRWLIELQSILDSQGSIDPGLVPGLDALTAQVAALSLQVAANTVNIATAFTQIGVLNGQVATNTADILALQARSVVRNGTGVPGAGLGSNGDLYINNTGGAGTRLYSKIGGAWVATA